MSISPGTRLGPYEVTAPLGVGGMGEVYRATDTNLKRSVAIKVLPQALATDPDRLARFQREAEVLAALNHPHIAGIYGLERSDGVTALVMELVDGPTLADRIGAGPIPFAEALPIATQLADALGAAHEANIVHRDLKPANIKIRPDGTVKVLDFGLAKAMEPSVVGSGSVSASMSPTITTPAMTQAGMILGTAAYMSPEQAKGRPVDRRTDVWAFGCVLYEMLTGRRAFDGEDVTDTIAAIVRGEPDWAALPSEVTPQIRLLIKRCLDKDRRKRISDASVARFLLTEVVTTDSVGSGASVTAAAQTKSGHHVFIAAAAGVLIGAAIAAASAWAFFRTTGNESARPARFGIVSPSGYGLSLGNDRDVAISPDGSIIIYRAGMGPVNQTQLVVRPIGDVEVRPLAGTTGARNPFFSPDGRWVGYFVPGELHRMPATGGQPILVCAVDGPPRGASWGDDDSIIFATLQGGLQRVPSSGGEPKHITSPASDKGESDTYPWILPGSQTVLFTRRTSTSSEISSINVLELKNGRQKMLFAGGSDPMYTATGHVIYAVVTPGVNTGRSGSLRAVRFDEKRLEAIGDHVAVLDKVLINTTGAADVALSRHGDLVYVPDDPRLVVQAQPRSLTWVDRRGVETPVPAPPRSYAVARLSPDGVRVALDIRDQTNDIWIWDLARHTLTPLNRDPAQDLSPLWTPDGRRIIWTSTRGGGNPNLYEQAADGTGAPERLTTVPGNQFPTSISQDGSRIVLFGTGPLSTILYSVLLDPGKRNAEPLVKGPSTYFGGELSPNGHWLAYHSNESGEFQVYVRPFPNVDSGRVPISTKGGTRAAWARNGRELFYLDQSGFLTSVPVQVKDGVFTAGAPVKILDRQYYAGFSALGLDLRAYDVAPDGQRFLMIKEAAAFAPPSNVSPLSMMVVLNWFEELKARMPASK